MQGESEKNVIRKSCVNESGLIEDCETMVSLGEGFLGE